jgi:hypothetical protein
MPGRGTSGQLLQRDTFAAGGEGGRHADITRNAAFAQSSHSQALDASVLVRDSGTAPSYISRHNPLAHHPGARKYLPSDGRRRWMALCSLGF